MALIEKALWGLKKTATIILGFKAFTYKSGVITWHRRPITVEVTQRYCEQLVGLLAVAVMVVMLIRRGTIAYAQQIRAAATRHSLASGWTVKMLAQLALTHRQGCGLGRKHHCDEK